MNSIVGSIVRVIKNYIIIYTGVTRAARLNSKSMRECAVNNMVVTYAASRFIRYCSCITFAIIFL